MKVLKSTIPSIITLANLSCGVAVLFYDIKYGVFLIMAGAFLDLWDGLAARYLKVETDLGKQLDSLADLVTFCIAPAFLLFNTIEEPYNIIAFFIPATGALRLAKFNISDDQTYFFKGLATPASGFLFTGIAVAYEHLFSHAIIPIILLILFACFLNVSTLRMFSAKGFKKDPYSKYYVVISTLVFITVAIINWKFSFLAAVVFYILLSLLYHFQTRPKSSKD